MKNLKYFFVGLPALLLVACQPAALIVHSGSEESQVLALKGSQLSLSEPLMVGAGKARVFIQDGKMRSGYDVNEYKAQCNFEIESVAHQGVTIKPDTFEIRRVQRLHESVVLRQSVEVAALSLSGIFSDSGGPSASFMGYHFWLASARQPQVRRMTCHGVYAEPYDLQPPTLQEIREALGNIAQFRR